MDADQPPRESGSMARVAEAEYSRAPRAVRCGHQRRSWPGRSRDAAISAPHRARGRPAVRRRPGADSFSGAVGLRIAGARGALDGPAELYDLSRATCPIAKSLSEAATGAPSWGGRLPDAPDGPRTCSSGAATTSSRTKAIPTTCRSAATAVITAALATMPKQVSRGRSGPRRASSSAHRYDSTVSSALPVVGSRIVGAARLGWRVR